MAFDPTPGFSLGITNKIKSVIPQFGVQNGRYVEASNPGADRSAALEKRGSPKHSGGNNNNDKQGKPESPANPGDSLGLSGSGGAASINPADIAYLNSQEGRLRDMLGRSGSALNQGLAGLNDSYNREVGNANQQRSRALEDFRIQREGTTRAKQDALGRVDTNARTLSNSLRRTLGMAGGSNSSAYLYAAPNAVAREASGERNEVLSDYAQNDRSLGLAEKRTGEDFESLLGDLQRDKNAKEQELRSGVLENEQNVNQQLADIAARRSSLQGGSLQSAIAAQQPYSDAINSRQSEIDSLFERFRSPQLQARALNVATPELKDYMVDKTGIQAGGGQQQEASPYSNYLRRPEDEQLF